MTHLEISEKDLLKLECFVVLLSTDNKQQFSMAYKAITGAGGKSIWNEMYLKGKKKKKNR